MARASTHTLLALDRFAKILGLTPPHFNQAAGTTVFTNRPCNDIFFQYAWQFSDTISREDIAIAIKSAEDDITRALGFSPAPVWIESEMHVFPRFHRPEYFTANGFNNRGQRKSFQSGLGKFILAGRRSTSEVTSGATVTYSDPDGDGFDELATITTPTTLTEKCEIKCYFAGEGGEQEWEVRPAKTVTLSGGNITFTFDSWQLIDPDLWGAFPTDTNLSAIVLETSGNYVTTVDVYREFTDFTQSSAQFYWEPTPTINGLNISGLCPNCSSTTGTCVACSLTTQTGCMHVRDVNNGITVPQPATYNSTTTQWDAADYVVCREPDIVKLWYYAGDLSQRYLSNKDCDPLSDFYAYAITWLAVARLDRPLCSCSAVKALTQNLMEDLASLGDQSHLLSEDDINNPFGTRRGAIQAWRRIGRLTSSNIGVAAV